MNVSISPSLEPHFDPPAPTEGDAEAALEALRVAIGQPAEDIPAPPVPTSNRSQILSANETQQTLERALAALNQLSSTSQTIVDNMNLPSVISGLSGSLRMLVESNRRQADIVRDLVGQLSGQANIAPALTISFVSRAEYDALKTRYDALLSSSSGGSSRRARTARQSMNAVHREDRSRDGESATPLDEKPGGRKKRSMKLEHLVHKMANRRLGVEYAVTQFEVTGSRDLPDPDSEPPRIAESFNGIQEYHPDFRGDINATSVRPFIDAVVDDCVEAWEAGVGIGELEADRKKIQEAVNVYWTRLCKRYDEQLTRERGEVHKDEITRRKQNQYRRQQSLLSRRVAAFDQSPLNACKLRAMYRTLLTIDFAAQTQEKPDPNRKYTENTWRAYQKLAGGKGDAHEVVDQFWLSNSARTLLNILDVSSIDQAARSKRKGRPKQPATTFHLPYDLWDHQSLPILRPKDANGLPVSGAAGIILFKFHVDEAVQAQHSEWAKGLYDNPPLPEEDARLSSLETVMNASVYQHLQPMAKVARDAAIARPLSPEEVTEILSRPAVRNVNTMEDPDSPEGITDPAFMSRSLESFVALASQPANSSNDPFVLAHASPIAPLANIDGSLIGPSPGSSIRARKQSKRLASELPGGAATPVPKKRRATEEDGDGEEVEVEVEGDLKGDGSFLDSL